MVGLGVWGVEDVAGNSSAVTIDKVASNPVSDGNRGEYIVLYAAEEQDLTGWKLQNNDRSVPLPNSSLEGHQAISNEPHTTSLLTTYDTMPLDGYFPLAADGSKLELISDSGETVQKVSVPPLRAQEVFRPTKDSGSIQYQGATTFEFEEHTSVYVTPFVLPDSSDIPADTLAAAEERILLSGYELTDPLIVDILLNRHAEGVKVQVLLDGRPVGGQEEAEISALNRLIEAGIPVRTFAGERDRYRFHHPKYAVIDDSALVMTENWKPAGTGGHSSRGWGVLVDDEAVSSDLATTFTQDFAWRDTVAWEWDRLDRTPVESSVPGIQYSEIFSAPDATAGSVELVVTPEMGESRISEELANAEQEIYVQQVSLTDKNFALIQDLIEAANRGVAVTILLDNSWYVSDENAQIRDSLPTAADDASNLSVDLVEPTDRFEKIHTKGILIDNRTTIVGSMNWNNVSMLENREVMLVIESEDTTRFFKSVFHEDIQPPGRQTPVELVLITIGTWLLAGLLARKRIDLAG